MANHDQNDTDSSIYGVADPAVMDFELFLKKFKADANLTKKDVLEFKSITVEEVKREIATIQQMQISRNRQRYMNRLHPFLKSMEQFGAVVEVFLNTSEFVAFIWVSV